MKSQKGLEQKAQNLIGETIETLCGGKEKNLEFEQATPNFRVIEVEM